jgi:hypothetical protein
MRKITIFFGHSLNFFSAAVLWILTLLILILDPKTATKEGGKISCPFFFVATNITKLKLISFLKKTDKEKKFEPIH